MPEDSQPTSSVGTSGVPSSTPSPTDILISLKEEREKNEKALVDMKKIMEENTKIATRIVMGGDSYAGKTQQKDKTADDVAQDMADDVVKRIWGRL